jgi:aspartate kinase
MSVVMKFGGTSVGTIELIHKIANYIKNRKDTEENIVVVVSAMGKSTDYLIEMAKQVSKKLNKREIDTLLATGEQQTIALLSLALQNEDVDAISLTGFQAGFKTTSTHNKGIIKDVDVVRVKHHLEEGKVVVVAGFQGISEDGDITTLGRGGSDTSAVALAAKLGYKCEIYTDVDGIYTVDPRVYQKAKKIDKISYEEIMEMSALGAGVLETRSVELAKKFNVPLYLGKSLSEEGSGTYIMNEEILLETKPITGISITDHVAMITLEQETIDLTQISNIFKLVSEESVSLDMISQNVDKLQYLMVSFSINETDLETFESLQETKKEAFEGITVHKQTGLIKVSLVGLGMATNFGVASRLFDTLTKANIPMYTVSTSEISISITTDQPYKEQATTILAKEFHL